MCIRDDAATPSRPRTKLLPSNNAYGTVVLLGVPVQPLDANGQKLSNRQKRVQVRVHVPYVIGTRMSTRKYGKRTQQ